MIIDVKWTRTWTWMTLTLKLTLTYVDVDVDVDADLALTLLGFDIDTLYGRIDIDTASGPAALMMCSLTPACRMPQAA